MIIIHIILPVHITLPHIVICIFIGPPFRRNISSQFFAIYYNIHKIILIPFQGPAFQNGDTLTSGILSTSKALVNFVSNASPDAKLLLGVSEYDKAQIIQWVQYYETHLKPAADDHQAMLNRAEVTIFHSYHYHSIIIIFSCYLYLVVRAHATGGARGAMAPPIFRKVKAFSST